MRHMLRNLILALMVFSCSVFGQAGSPEGDTLPMGPFQLPVRADFNGEWLRFDGVYTLSIDVKPKNVTVEYHNPNPINVEYVGLDEASGLFSLEVMLLDEGYPGTTYTLSYLPEYEVLAGTYQVPGQAPSQVYFKRKPIEDE